MDIKIRRAVLEDAEALPGIERSAGAVFRTLPGLEWLAIARAVPAEKHRQWMHGGAVWLAEHDGKPVAFISTEIVDAQMHLWELDVAADFQRGGIGRRLIQTAIDHAKVAGIQEITFTTFRDVAFNAPFYAQLGFREVSANELDEWLSAILQAEAENGLPMERRCAMRMRL